MSFSASNLEATSPHINDNYIISATAGEALTIGQVVEVTSDWIVKASTLTTTPSNKVAGVMLNSPASGKAATVLCRGIARIQAYGTITAGDSVASGPNGTIQTVAQPTATDCNTSAGTAAAISKIVGAIGKALVGASSGGTAIVLMNVL
jgi:hypothetical protein